MRIAGIAAGAHDDEEPHQVFRSPTASACPCASRQDTSWALVLPCSRHQLAAMLRLPVATLCRERARPLTPAIGGRERPAERTVSCRSGTADASILLASGARFAGGRGVPGGSLAGPEAQAAAISFLPPVNYDKPGAGDLTAVDLDGDGKLDLAVIGGGAVSILYGNGDGTFNPRVDIPLGRDQ